MGKVGSRINTFLQFYDSQNIIFGIYLSIKEYTFLIWAQSFVPFVRELRGRFSKFSLPVMKPPANIGRKVVKNFIILKCYDRITKHEHIFPPIHGFQQLYIHKTIFNKYVFLDEAQDTNKIFVYYLEYKNYECETENYLHFVDKMFISQILVESAATGSQIYILWRKYLTGCDKS